MKKHILPFAVLAFILLLGMLPGAVFAGDDHACETLLDGAYWKLFGKVGYPKDDDGVHGESLQSL